MSKPSNYPNSLIAPTSLLTIHSRKEQEDGRSSNFNPHYFQAYNDRLDDNCNITKLKDLTNRGPSQDDYYDSSQRHLQEFVVRNLQRQKSEKGLPLLNRNGRQTQHQLLYTSLTDHIVPTHSHAEGMSLDDEDAAAAHIQSLYRGRMGRKEYERQLRYEEERERAAIRVQCAWRGRMGYSAMLARRAKNHDENVAATRLQSRLRAKNDRERYLHKRAFMSEQEIMATKIQCAFRGRQARIRMINQRRERTNLVATTNAWGETENGLALLVDLSAFKTKFTYSNVMTVLGSGGAEGNVKEKSAADGFDTTFEEDGENEQMLEELKGESASLAKQLARIEVMTEELEEEFGRTGDQLLDFKQQMTKGLADASTSQVSSRLNMLDYENEILRKREEERKDKERRKARGVEGRGGGRDEIHKNPTAEQAESDMKECWDLIEELQGQLYTKK